jgi:UDP-2,3-diacylglucosamine hydrolase
MGEAARPVAILAGNGMLPIVVTKAALQGGRPVIVLALAGEAEPADFGPVPVHTIRWGEIGRMLRLLAENRCDEVVLIGSILHRPDYRMIRPDFGAVKLIPRILRLMMERDGSVLAGVARLFEEHGIRVVSPLAVAPNLALEEGCLVGSLTPRSKEDIAEAQAAAREIGRKDIAQGAVAVDGRVVAVEDASGTDALLERVALLRRSGGITRAGGVLVKCLKPIQDGRHDLPTVGPATAANAKRAGLDGVAAEAGRTILVGREETLEAFRKAGLFLFGLNAPKPEHG